MLTPFFKTKPMQAGHYSEEYLKWVQQAKLPALTNTQHRFAEWLLQEDNAKVLSQVGNLESIFESIRHYVRDGKYTFNK